jgi:prophage regulatory protein
MDDHTSLEKFIMLPQVREVVPYSASHLWRLERAGQFPKRVRLGGNRVAWVQSEVSAWVESKLASRSDSTQHGASQQKPGTVL